MIPRLIKLKNSLLNVLFPPVCLNCRKIISDGGKIICEPCLSLIKSHNTLFCPICRARQSENKKICHFNANYSLAAATEYDNPIVKELIRCFKYGHFKNIAPIFGEILAKYVEKCGLKIENFILVPIPLHPFRQRKRGYNQSELIAEEISKRLNLKLVPAIKRMKNTKNQAHLKNFEERTENTESCFDVAEPDEIKNKKIILIDDVFTSGATINEAVKILKKNGAGKIIALVVAKA